MHGANFCTPPAEEMYTDSRSDDESTQLVNIKPDMHSGKLDDSVSSHSLPRSFVRLQYSVF